MCSPQGIYQGSHKSEPEYCGRAICNTSLSDPLTEETSESVVSCGMLSSPLEINSGAFLRLLAPL